MKPSVFRIVANGIHPLLLGMTREQVEAVAGGPLKSETSRIPGEQVLRLEEMHARVVLREDKVVEIGIYPPARVLFQGRSLFDAPETWRALVANDADVRESLGF